MLMSGATVDKKREYSNSVPGPNISTIDANGPFWPTIGAFCVDGLRPVLLWVGELDLSTILVGPC